MLALYAPGERAHGFLSPYLVVLAHGFLFLCFSSPLPRSNGACGEDSGFSLCLWSEESTRPKSRTRLRAGRAGRADEGTVKLRVGCALARGWRETPQAEGRGQGVDVYQVVNF